MRHTRRPSLRRRARSVGPSGPRVPLQRRCIPRFGVVQRPTLRPMHAGSILPRLEWVRSYRRAALGRDVFAGIVLTAILIPAGMGYAEASGLPPIIGLYATILPLLAYALLGPSRILVLGPGLGAAADHRRGDRAARGRRRGAGRRAGRAAGGPRRPDRHGGGVRPARVPDRSPVRARAAGLPQRHRADHRGQPAAPAVRVQRGR